MMRVPLKNLRSPFKVQAWLKTLPYNSDNTMYSLQGVLRRGRAHCLEGALCAAALLEPHGYPPLILDLESADLLDHTLFIFQERGKWGSVGVSRDVGLHGRQPVFRDVGSLAKSYAIPYIDHQAELEAFGILDLRNLSPRWRTTTQGVWYVENALREIPHRPLRMSRRTVQHWRQRRKRFKDGHPTNQPNYYPGQHTWM